LSGGVGRLARLIRKELSEILRDRRTVITLVFMPLLLYPLLSVAFRNLFIASRGSADQAAHYHIGFTSETDRDRFYRRLLLGDKVIESRGARPFKDEAPPRSAPELFATVDSYERLEERLRAGTLDLIIKPVDDGGAAAALPAEKRDRLFNYALVYLPSAPGAQGVLDFLDSRLAAANELDLFYRLNTVKAPRVSLLVVARTPLEEPPGAGSFISLASLVPLILIMMTITGAVYPAIDLTAGERERGTLEILVAAPVPRLGLLFAKYVSVFTVAVLTAVVNLTAMMATLIFSGLGQILFRDAGLSPGMIVQLLGLLLLFAAFFSAVLLCITSFARSFKEAQAYLIPLMLASLGPGVMGMIPGLTLERWAVTPLLNIVLLGRDLFEGDPALGTTLLVVFSTLIYSLAAIGLAARIFGAESVLYSEQSSWGDLFRRPEMPQPTAGVTAALWCLALMIPVNFMLQGTAILFLQAGLLPPDRQIFVGPIHALALFGFLPLLFAWRGRLRLSTAFGLTRPRLAALLGGVVLGLSLWPLLFWIMIQTTVNVSEDQQALIEQIAAMFRGLAPGVKIAIVVIPAILEELFFRGYLFGALEGRLRTAGVIVVTGLLFGLTHVLFRTEFGFTRLLPSTLMGLVLGAVRAASGSVVPGMLLHACHNAVLVMLPEGYGGVAPNEVPPLWLAASAAGTCVGAALLWCGRGPTGTPAAPAPAD
jgi:sodium transport system permease protein